MINHRPDPRTGSGPSGVATSRRVKIAAGVFLGLSLASAGLCASPQPALESLGPRIDELTFISAVLHREMKLVVVRPATELAAAKSPVLYFLHGRGRNRRSLIDLPASRQQLLDANCWIVLPDGEDGWYVNLPAIATDRYSDYLEEVIRMADTHYGLTRESARRAIGGWSMGGYGAMRFAQTHPDEFGVVATIIGLLDFPRETNLPTGQNYEVPVARFGTDRAVWRANNPLYNLAPLRGKAVLVITADEAFDHTMNVNFSAALSAAEIPHKFRRLPGAHTLDVVQAALSGVLEFVRRQTAAPIRP